MMRSTTLVITGTLLSAAVLNGCSGKEPMAALVNTAPASEATGWKQVTVMDRFDRPWGMTWLPDGQMLITEKGGRLWHVDPKAGTRKEVQGLPAIFSGGQGGLMDVSLHPDFAQNQLVYLTASMGNNGQNGTTLLRGRLSGNQLLNVRGIFQVSQLKDGGQHFGSRIVWMPDKTMLVSIGDGGNPPAKLNGDFIRNNAQNLNSHYGKVLRLTADGLPAPGNPFAAQGGAAATVYSYGHRNIQGMVYDPATKRVWANEHGAKGGDELNLITSGSNYGWPKATHSVEYWGPKISDATSLPGMKDPAAIWTPCKGPSGLAVYTGDKMPAWKGSLFSGGLVGNGVWRIQLDAAGKVTNQEKLNINARVRDVRQGPDGFLYLITDEGNGRLIRIEPA